MYTDGTSGYLNDAESVPARQTTTTVADRLSRSPGGATVNTLSRLNDDLDEKFDESVTASDGVTGDGEKTGTQDTPGGQCGNQRLSQHGAAFKFTGYSFFIYSYLF